MRLKGALIAVTERQREGMVALARGGRIHGPRDRRDIYAAARSLGAGHRHRHAWRAVGRRRLGGDAPRHRQAQRAQSLLLKPGTLTSEEWEACAATQCTVSGSGRRDRFEMARGRPLASQDFDGRGYPDGLAGGSDPPGGAHPSASPTPTRDVPRPPVQGRPVSRLGHRGARTCPARSSYPGSSALHSPCTNG